jgi:HSP20 family protein
MVMRFADPFDTLFAFQQALENRQLSDWLGTSTAGMGSYPPINVFQQGDDLVAIIELPGVNKADINIQAKEDTIRISGRKSIAPHISCSHADRSRQNATSNIRLLVGGE